MGEVAAPGRERLLRSKKDDLNGIVASRKRKLRELYAVCDNDFPIPKISLSNIDAPPTTAAEKHFLEVSDIQQARLFDESNLPTRRSLRSSTLKHRSPIRKRSPEIGAADASRKLIKSQPDGSVSRNSRATTPSSKSDGVQNVAVGKETNRGQELQMQRSTSKGSQTDQPVDATSSPNVSEEPSVIPVLQTPHVPAGTGLTNEFEGARIRERLESPLNSPGADPRKVLPVSAEETALFPPTADALGSNDVQHKAATVHLPSQEAQEGRLRESKRMRQRGEQQSRHLSINLPPRDGPRTEPVSSPGSTIGANSATTPLPHEASADTSPENDNNRYDAERLDKLDDAQTPQELRPSPEEAAAKEQHDRIQRAQIAVSRREILGDDSGVAEKLLNSGLESVPRSSQSINDSPAAAERLDGQDMADSLMKESNELVDDVIEDPDEVDAVPTPEDDRMLGVEKTSVESAKTQREVADSEADDNSPLHDATQTDKATVEPSSKTAAGPEIPSVAEGSEPNPVEGKNSTVAPASRTTPPAVSQPLERMTTRVSSGALRHKSVSEILGQIPPPNTNASSERVATKGVGDSGSAGSSGTASRSATPQSPSARARSHVEKAKEKERSKLSTVVFPGPGRPALKPVSDDGIMVPSRGAKDDYFMDLFLATAIADKRAMPSLDNLISTSHKTITTSNAFVPIIEHQTLKILKRIYNLQSSQKWSLRQPKRSAEPIRPTTHWDVLLQEAKWMRTDFREERKWKMAVAKNLATACAEWVNDTENRKLLQVKAVPPKPAGPVETSDEMDIDESPSQADSVPIPDLEAFGEIDEPMDDFDEEPQLSLLDTISPAALFTLQDDDVIFGLRRSPTSDKLLNELPMYGAPLIVPQSELPTSELDPDRFWRRPALPLSKFVEGRLELKSEKAHRKQSRFAHEDDDDDDDEVVFGQVGTRQPVLPPGSTEVALFNPEHKHIRDRIHSSHQFRPPSEFPMPQQSFFECRTASQWTWSEDDDLKAHVRKYSYNWSLISSLLTSKSLFTSGAERRTPWECFERWINLEGLPADMQKTHYFRTYTNRIDQANRAIMVQAAQAPQQPSANGQIQPPPRKRPTTSVRVERRRNQKHLTLVDAMRKLAKKRETSLQKQQHAAGLAAMRKANEVVQPRGPLHNPQDFSRLKHEREEQMRDRIIQVQQRQEASRRAALLQQRNAAHVPQPPGVNGVLLPVTPSQQRQPPVNGLPNGNLNASGQNLTVPGQNRPRQMPPQMPNPSMQNGLRAPPMAMNGVPSVPMHGIQGQLPLPNPALDVGLVARAQNISEQQRQAIRMQQQGQLQGQSPQMHNSPPRMNGMPQPGFQMPNNMMPPFNSNPNGVGTPPSNNMINSPGQGQGQAGSPRMGQPHNNSVLPVKALEQQLQAKYPAATPEQITRMIQDHLAKQVHAHQARQGLAQSAMNAAAGGHSMGGMNPGIAGQSPQLYAQLLRQQQENQQKLSQPQQGVANTGNVQNPGNGQVNNAAGGNANGPQRHTHRLSSGSAQGGGK